MAEFEVRILLRTYAAVTGFFVPFLPTEGGWRYCARGQGLSLDWSPALL
jgi:hypothetical protein